MIHNINKNIDLKYYILKKDDLLDSKDCEIYNEVYLSWSKDWYAIFESVGGINAFSPDEFFKMNYICCLYYNNQLAAYHGMTNFNLSLLSTLDTRYFKIFDKDDIQFLLSHNRKKLMSLEYLTVKESFRKSEIDIQFAPIMCALGLKHMENLNSDALVAPVRKVNKVNFISDSLGARTLKKDVNRGNHLCDLITVFVEEIKSLENKVTMNYIEVLWKNKIVNFDLENDRKNINRKLKAA